MFVLLACVLLLFAVLGVVLSAERIARDDKQFGDIFSAISTVFTFMATAENWPDVVWPMTACRKSVGGHAQTSGLCLNWFFHIFFVIASLMGSLIMISLIIATFEQKFTAHRNMCLRRKRQQWLQGIVAAFVVLDISGAGLLSLPQISEFFTSCGLDRRVRLGKLAMGFGVRLGVAEFAELCEQLKGEIGYAVSVNETAKQSPDLRRTKTMKHFNDSDTLAVQHVYVASKKVRDRSAELLELDKATVDTRKHATRCSISITSYVESTLHCWLMFAASMLHVLVLSSIEIFALSDVDSACWVFFWLFQADIMLRLAGGFYTFWWVPSDFYSQQKNRYDFGVSCLSLGMFVFVVVQKLSVPEPLPAEDLALAFWYDLRGWNRVTLALPGFRLFSAVNTVRVTWFCMLAILPQIASTFILLLMSFFAFACLGCWQMAGAFHFLGTEAYELPQANFNSMLDSLTTLFQLFIGEAWNSVAEAAVATEGGFIHLYFLAFILCMSVLFFNIIAGVILSSFDVVELLRATERRDGTLDVRSFQRITAHGSADAPRLSVQFDADRTVHIAASARTLFSFLDSDQSGSITWGELVEHLGSETKANQVWAELDADGDGEVTMADLAFYRAPTTISRTGSSNQSPALSPTLQP